MNLLKINLLALVILASTLLSHAEAALLSIETDRSQYQIGDTVTSRLYLSDFAGPLTGAFVALSHDKNGLTLDSWQLADAFNDGLGAYSFADYLAADGKLFLESYADWAADLSVLAQQQGSKFLFATLRFTVTRAGFYQLSPDRDYQGALGSEGDLLALDWQQAGFSVDAAAVPAPASVWLLLPLLMLLRSARRSQF